MKCTLLFAVGCVCVIAPVDSTQAQCTPELPANVLRVDANSPVLNPEDADGESWACAFPDLQQAIDKLTANTELYDTIWVAQGSYTPSEELVLSVGDAARRVTFRIPATTRLIGGFLGNAHPNGGETSEVEADPEANVTILSGDLMGDDDPLDPLSLDDNAYHVAVVWTDDVFPIELTVIDGITFTGGVADGFDHNSVGGALYLRRDTAGSDGSVGPQIRRCKFIGNTSSDAGGAVVGIVTGGRFRDCEFRDNSTGGVGFDRETIVGGGAVSISSKAILHVVKSKFVNNHSGAWTGGAVRDTHEDSWFVNCEFYANTAPDGSAVNTDGTLVNCVFAGNRATAGSGGAVLGGEIHACTFADNYAQDIGAGASTGRNVTNSIFWNNEFGGQPSLLWKGSADIGFQGGGAYNNWNLIEDWECSVSTDMCPPQRAWAVLVYRSELYRRPAVCRSRRSERWPGNV